MFNESVMTHLFIRLSNSCQQTKRTPESLRDKKPVIRSKSYPKDNNRCVNMSESFQQTHLLFLHILLHSISGCHAARSAAAG